MKYLLLFAILLAGCLSTSTPNPEQNGRNAAINQVVLDSSAILGKAAVSGLVSAVSQEAGAGKVDWQQAGGAALESTISYTDVTSGVQRAMAAYTAGKAPKTVTAAVAAYGDAVSGGVDPNVAKQAIANVIFAETGAPPANPGLAVSKALSAGQP